MDTLTDLVPKEMKVHCVNGYPYLNQDTQSRSKKIHSLHTCLLGAYYTDGGMLRVGGRFVVNLTSLLGHDFF